MKFQYNCGCSLIQKWTNINPKYLKDSCQNNPEYDDKGQNATSSAADSGVSRVRGTGWSLADIVEAQERD